MMSKKLIPLFLAVSFICQLLIITNASAAQSLEDLVNNGKLTINLQVHQKEPQIVGQALILAIEISTDRWFATGSKVQHFTLANTVMQANNITTINGSKRIEGQTWAMQTHEITLYPTAPGSYQVPPILVAVSVNTEDNGIVSGTLNTEASSFTIELPEALIGIDSFIVSPQVTLSIDGQFDEEKDYAVGDAITQTITITATDTPAMMITPIKQLTNKKSVNSNAKYSTGIAGLSIYHKPVKIFDKSNRGELIGTSIESFTYIFEQPGSYVINKQIIYWWNSQSHILEELIIPASAWTVSGGGLSQLDNSSPFLTFSINFATIVNIAIVMLLLTLTYLVFIKRQQLSTFYNKLTKREQRVLRKRFLTSVTNKDYLTASQYIYQYTSLSSTGLSNKNISNRELADIELSNKQAAAPLSPLADKLNQLAFNNATSEAATKQSLSFSVNDAKALIKQIDTSITIKVNTAKFIPHERIKLNKG